ncbi:hypothetical protein [Brevundimonas lenta]|uniref:Uncharacterized protein n=1 Tax=Brevundimonas lenta TaxID=424796 RepID=A0A7W6JGH5_9CAUL|nr:hypothetical protein [Brevundimonas lenta]MBB4083698.1 hypothetical protein [Brevundimonas lenta]
MSAFEFFFSFYGLILGLSVAEIVTGLVRVFKQRQRVRVGWLTPMLALFVLLDIASFWVGAWISMQDLNVSYRLIFLGLVIAGIYFAAASLVTPDDLNEWPDFDDFYDRHKRFVLAGVAIANLIASHLVRPLSGGGMENYAAPEVWFWIVSNNLFLLVLALVRNRRINVALLAFGIGMYLLTAVLG